MAKKRTSRPVSRQTRPTKQSLWQRFPLWMWGAGIGLVGVLLVGALFYLGYYDPAATNNDIEGLVIFPDPGRDHLSGDIDYVQDAPPGGPHNPTWLNCGIYDEPVRVENVLHSLEHGAVWLAYQPDLAIEQVERLRSLTRQEQSRLGERLIILAPRPNLEDPIVATAWRAQLRLEDASDERLTSFVRRYQKGPFTPEPGADCTFGGIGEPLS